MVACAVKNCEVNSYQVKQQNLKIKLHQIPKHGSRRQLWLDFCGIESSDNDAPLIFVCSRHFTPDDYHNYHDKNFQRRVLVREAIPTIKKPKKPKRKNSQESEEEQRKKRKEEIDKILSGDLPEPIAYPFRQKNAGSKTNSDKVSKLNISSKNNDQSKSEANAMFENVVKIRSPLKEDSRLKSLDAENRALKLKINELEQLIEKKNEKINLAKTEMVNITIALQELKDIENRNLNIRVKELLQGHYTENQIRRVFCSKDAVTWNNEEMQKAFVLRMHGAGIYDYICSELNYPFPNPKEMLQYVQRIYQQTGFLIPCLSVLHALGSKMEPHERECVLLLGRTKVCPEYHYDTARDQIFGKDGYLYCICVQGILADWRQIIYVDFDLIYSTELLVALINELHDVGFNVVGLSGTCDQEIADLWTEFDVSVEQHYIGHPKTKQPIYMFACAISTLSIVRKTFVEDGFQVQDDVQISKDIVQKLYESNHPEIFQLLSTTTLDTLLNESDFSEVSSLDDMISSNVIKALKILSEEGEEAVNVLATLFELFRDWYDLMTTASDAAEEVEDVVITHQQYGMNVEEQNIVLDGMYDTIESLKCSSEQSSFMQKAILVSLNSLKKLLIDLRKRHDCTSLPTSTLTLCNLSQIFDAFQNIHASCVQSISKILFQLSTAIAESDVSSLSNRIIEVAHLPTEKMEYDEPDTVVDPSIANISEKQACSHLTEYVANALRGKYEYLGDQTFVIERKDNSYVVMPEMPTGMVEPSRLWIEQAKKLEKYVSDITFYRNENVIENLVHSISRRHPKMGIDIIRLYVQRRIMIKLKNLNKDLEYV